MWPLRPPYVHHLLCPQQRGACSTSALAAAPRIVRSRAPPQTGGTWPWLRPAPAAGATAERLLVPCATQRLTASPLAQPAARQQQAAGVCRAGCSGLKTGALSVCANDQAGAAACRQTVEAVDTRHIDVRVVWLNMLHMWRHGQCCTCADGRTQHRACVQRMQSAAACQPEGLSSTVQRSNPAPDTRISPCRSRPAWAAAYDQCVRCRSPQLMRSATVLCSYRWSALPNST